MRNLLVCKNVLRNLAFSYFYQSYIHQKQNKLFRTQESQKGLNKACFTFPTFFWSSLWSMLSMLMKNMQNWKSKFSVRFLRYNNCTRKTIWTALHFKIIYEDISPLVKIDLCPVNKIQVLRKLLKLRIINKILDKY